MNIRVLHVMAGADVGGAELFFLDALSALAEMPEIEQFVVTRPEAYRIKTIRQLKIPYITAGFSKWWPFPTHTAIRRAIATFQPDIVQYWMGRAGQFAECGTHLNVAWYGDYYDCKRRFSKCTHHIVVTRDLHRHVRESGIADRDISVIHTLAAFQENSPPVERCQYTTPQDAPLLLALARLHHRKGLDILLRALVDLTDCYAWIAGDGPIREELMRLAEQLGVASRVRFLGWRHDRDALLNACDIVTFPSRYEPFGTVIIEAWATRRPLIAADAQGPEAYVKNGENGLLIPRDDVSALIAAVRRVQKNPELRQTIVDGGWTDFQTTFTKQALQRDSLAVYSMLAARRKSGVSHVS
jgi:glycosyltransferase involved in cell wall biosynthesis